ERRDCERIGRRLTRRSATALSRTEHESATGTLANVVGWGLGAGRLAPVVGIRNGHPEGEKPDLEVGTPCIVSGCGLRGGGRDAEGVGQRGSIRNARAHEIG